MDKIAALNEILQLDPANAFARYGLGMEHLSLAQPDAALAEFAKVIEHNPDYVPAYQMSAQTLAKSKPVGRGGHDPEARAGSGGANRKWACGERDARPAR